MTSPTLTAVPNYKYYIVGSDQVPIIGGDDFGELPLQLVLQPALWPENVRFWMELSAYVDDRKVLQWLPEYGTQQEEDWRDIRCVEATRHIQSFNQYNRVEFWFCARFLDVLDSVLGCHIEDLAGENSWRLRQFEWPVQEWISAGVVVKRAECLLEWLPVRNGWVRSDFGLEFPSESEKFPYKWKVRQ